MRALGADTIRLAMDSGVNSQQSSVRQGEAIMRQGIKKTHLATDSGLHAGELKGETQGEDRTEELCRTWDLGLGGGEGTSDRP